MEIEIEISDINIVLDKEKIKGIATIDLKGILKIAGIKIMQGSHNLYCCCPNQSYSEKGLRKWSNILTFEQNLWARVQEKILKKYEEKDTKGDDRRNT
jgi:DNA-binding cell septation regulator SpoVG